MYILVSGWIKSLGLKFTLTQLSANYEKNVHVFTEFVFI